MMIKNSARVLLDKVLLRFGCHIMPSSTHMISDRLTGLPKPKVIVDVGVGRGTPELYDAFSDQQLVLLEPLREYEPVLSKICTTRQNCSYLITAVGADNTVREINVEPEDWQLSSLVARSALTSTSGYAQPRQVRVATLDTIVSNLSLSGPFGLKIDTEGYELPVIMGATEFLRNTLFVIAEVSIMRRFENSYTLEEFVASMYERGFRVFDVLNIFQPETSGTRYLDLVFLRHDCMP